jgi:hypothetical protein
LFTGNHIDKID